ncbi:DUF5688 family protein [Diplocloster modestus]|uniref:Uncharacterized protein n=1 Tax=Diplocloster modestus TaxID=2850322 RepID=A0ABS6K494_9FIRM|nr:DUF5688 family protein [Diplocloster modestus]MBU9725310.1 hypothetical protein [Diplocloster modestus]
MNYEQFMECVRTRVEEVLGGEARVTVYSVVKNNSVKLDGLTIMERENNVSPTIYLNPYFEAFEHGMEMDKIVREILKVYTQCRPKQKFDTDYLKDYEKVKDRIVYRLVNYEKNRELLEQMPCIRFLDLAVIFYCLIAVGEEGTASVAVKSEYRKVWDITLPQIYEQAKINTPKLLPYVLQTMLEVLGELCDGMDTSGAVPMYVLTNQLRMNGAACILYPDVLRECSRKIGGDLLILPSSIHEVILMPDHGNGNRAELREMVEEINQTQLEAEEVLSGQVYRYERNTNKIIL